MLAANPPKCLFFLTHSLPRSSSPSPSFKITCSAAASVAEERSEIRLGLPSKGRMAADTLDLLKDCQLSVKHVNPLQQVAKIPELSNLEVWFQRPKDIVRKLLSRDLDLGIVGLDTVSEYGRGSEDLIIVHDALGYGECHLSLALGPKFAKENGLDHVSFSTPDGALEAAPAMGIADAILDLVSSGITLKENNLKEIEGGVVLQSQAVLVASKRSLLKKKSALETTHEILKTLEAHLKAKGQFRVVANMRGNSAQEVAERVLSLPSLTGLQGPTISTVYCKRDGQIKADHYAMVICVPKKALYKSVQQLRAIGGSPVLYSPLTCIFDEETPRWCELLAKIGL